MHCCPVFLPGPTQGKDLPPDGVVIKEPHTAAGKSLGLAPHALDTVMIVKRYLWDKTMSQEGQVVIPHTFLNKFLSNMPRTPTAIRPVNPPRDAIGWLTCALALLQTQEESLVVRAVRYLTALAEEKRGTSPHFPPLPWMHRSIGDPDLVNALAHQWQLVPTLVPAIRTNVQFRRLRQ